MSEMIKDSPEHNRLTQNIFDFVCVCVPGFKELVLDGKNRPFERKVKQHTNLKQVEHNIFAKTGGFGYINNVQVHYKLAIQDIKNVYKAGTLDPNTMKAMGYNKLTHMAMYWIPPIFTTNHAMERWRERSHMVSKGTVNTIEYEIVNYFTQEFKLRGDPVQTNGGIPVADGVFLGEWLQLGIMKELKLGAFIPVGNRGCVVWNSKHKSTKQIGCVPSDEAWQDNDWFFFAKTFISWNECSFNQAVLGKQILNNPEIEAQRFRRSGSQEWLPGDKTTSVVPTDWAKEFGITQH